MTKPPSPRPLSVKVITALLLYGAIYNLVLSVLLPSSGALAFGLILSGPAAQATYVLTAILVGALSWGLWRLYETTRRWAIAFLVYGMLNMVLATLIPSTRATHIDQLHKAGARSQLALITMLEGLAFLLITSALQIYFLIKRKSAFEKRTTSSQV